MASIQSKKSKTGKLTHYVVIAHAGKRRWLKAGSLKDARILKKQIESLDDSKRVEKLGLTSKQIRLNDFFEKFAEYVEFHNTASTAKRYLSVVRTFKGFLEIFHPNVTTLGQVNREHIDSYQMKRLESIELAEVVNSSPFGHRKKLLPKPQTVNYEVTVLRTAFLWAKERGWITEAPTDKFRKLKPTEDSPPRILTSQEAKDFLKASRDLARGDHSMKVFPLAFSFILNTGLRSGELCNLTWDDIDRKQNLLHVQAKDGWTPKTGPRNIPLNERALKILSMLDSKSQWLFERHNGDQLTQKTLQRALIRATREAEIADFTKVHGLRHTFASYLEMKGVDRGTVAELLGHKNISTTRLYAHRTADHLVESVNRLKVK